MTVRAVDDCNEADSRLAMETLTLVFGLAERAARQNLVEVSAGFPVSKGSSQAPPGGRRNSGVERTI